MVANIILMRFHFPFIFLTHRFSALYKWTKCINTTLGQSVGRTNTECKLGGRIQIITHRTSSISVWKWGRLIMPQPAHHLMILIFARFANKTNFSFSFCDGEQRFMQYLASSNSTFNLSNFLDKGGVQGKIKSSSFQNF